MARAETSSGSNKVSQYEEGSQCLKHNCGRPDKTSSDRRRCDSGTCPRRWFTRRGLYSQVSRSRRGIQVVNRYAEYDCESENFLCFNFLYSGDTEPGV